MLAVVVIIELLLSILTVKVSGKNPVRIGYNPRGNPTALIVERDSCNVTQFSGYTIDLLKWISADLNFQYQFVDMNYSEGFTGIPKEVNKKNIDLVINLTALKIGRNQMVTMLFPFFFLRYTLIIPYPKRQTDPWSCLNPYQLPVWILILVSMTLITILLQIVGSLREYNQDRRSKPQANYWPLKDTSMYVVGVVTNQGGYCTSKTRSLRAIAGLWCLAALVLVNAYSGSLITYLVSPKYKPLVNSIGEMAAKDDIQLLAQKDNFIYTLIQGAIDNLKPLATNLARVPGDFCGDFGTETFQRCLGYVKNGGHVIALDEIETRKILQRDYSATGECRLSMIEDPFFPSYAGFVAPLNATREFVQAVDISILRAISFGLLEKWKTSYERRQVDACKNFKSHKKETKRLSLKDLTSAFVILGIGYVVAFLVLLSEALTKKP